MSLRLIIEDDEGSTTVVPLASDAITIGRQQGNTIQLTEKNVSRRHARLFPESDGWIIEDLGSYNGIKVNNDRVDGRTKLREGDVVEIGDYHLAITEDVDKSPLNFRTGQAANDGALEPMLVSSSADLPRLSPEEIAALQSGQQPITPPPRAMMVDSGPVPAGHYHPGYAEPEGNKKTGLFVFLGIVVLGVVALGIFWFVTQKGGDSGEVAAGAGDGPGKKGEPAKAVTPPPDPTPSDDGTPTPADDGTPTPADGGTPDDAGDGAADAGDDAAAIDDGETPTEDDAGDAGDAGNGDDGAVEVVEDDPTEPKPKQPRPKQPKQPKQPKNDPKPTVDAAALLQEARDKQYKEPATAYRLAKQAYGAKPSSDALWVMGPAACRLKDKSKAEWVLKRLKGADKTKLQDICAQKGLEI